jgi:hypothetical protein
VGAVVNDVWLDGTRAGGVEDAVPTAPASRDQVIPGVWVDGAAKLRVAVPGDGEAVVQARVLTEKGPRAIPSGGVVRVQGGAVHDIDLSTLPAGMLGVQVRADRPVVAATVVTRSRPGQPGDFAWSSSTPPVSGVAGMPLARPAGADKDPNQRLILTASAGAVQAEVVTVDGEGALASQRVSVVADGAAGLNVSGAAAVWVHRVSGSGQLRAGLVTWAVDGGGALVAAAPLWDAPLRTTAVGMRPAPLP